MQKYNEFTQYLLENNKGDLSEFFNKDKNNKNSVLYKGKTINLQLSTNSNSNLQDALNNNLAIVDYKQCEKKLKEAGVLKEDDYIQALNNNIILPINDYSQSQNSLLTNIVNSKGEKVDTSLCKSFNIKIPTNNNLPNQQNYSEIKEKYNADIFNKTDDFFNDICFVYYDEKGKTDITLSQRKEMFNTTFTCSEGCKYQGIDNNGYYNCDCEEIDNTQSYGYSSDVVFELFINSNIEIAKCYMNILKYDFLDNYGFLMFTSVLGTWIVLLANYFFVSGIPTLINNYPKVIYNDSIDFTNRLLNNTINKSVYNPSSVGMPDYKNYNDVKNKDQSIISNNNSNNLFDSPTKSKVSHISNNKNSVSLALKDASNSTRINNYNSNNSYISFRSSDSIVTKTNKNKEKTSYTKNLVMNNYIDKKNNDKTRVVYNIYNKFRNYDSIITAKDLIKNKSYAFTNHELRKLPISTQLKLENTSILTAYWLELKFSHDIICLFFFYSIIKPYFIKLSLIFFSITIKLVCSAIFFSDKYIKQLAEEKQNNIIDSQSMNIWYTVLNQFWRIFWPTVISIVVKVLVKMIIIVKAIYIKELNEYLITQNKACIKLG